MWAISLEKKSRERERERVMWAISLEKKSREREGEWFFFFFLWL